MTSEKTRPFKGKSLIAFPQDFVVVDIETTGMSAASCAIIEISAVRFSADKPIETFSTLVDPQRRIDYFITRLTGITNAMVKGAPLIDRAIMDFYRFVGNSVIVGYNVNFDVNFLYDFLVRCHGIPLKNDFIDVLRIARRVLPELPDHKQTTVAEHFGISTRGAHRAETDCLICAAVLEKLKENILDGGVTLEDFAAGFKKNSRRRKEKSAE